LSRNNSAGQKFNYRIFANGSKELQNLWAYSLQYQGQPAWMGIDVQLLNRWKAISAEIELLGGQMTRRGNFSFPTKEALVHFKMVWG